MIGFNSLSASRLLLFLATVFISFKGNAAEMLIEHTLSDASLEFARYIVDAIWDHGTEYSFGNVWRCYDEHRIDVATIPTDVVWRYIRYTYGRTVGRKLQAPSVQSGFQVAVNITHTSKKGRAVIAAQPIKTGTIVYDPNYFSVEFLTAEEFRRFLQALPPHLGCDMLMWSYARLNEQREPRICVELDSSCMLNDAGGDEVVNLIPGRGIGRYSGCKLDLVAKKDIAEGEELMLDYNFSEEPTGWGSIDLKGDDEEFVNEDMSLYYDEVATWWDGNNDEL